MRTTALPAPPAWHAAIARALERGSSVPSSRYLQIATVRPDGRPTVRSVVFRGWFDAARDDDDDDFDESRSGLATVAGTPRLGFVTDARTAKVEHASLNPRAEACWYFTEARSQFRLSGTLAVVSALTAEADARARAMRLSAWERLSPGAREWHSSPAPGTEKTLSGEGGGENEKKPVSAPAAETSGRGGENETRTPPPPPHEHFCLVLLDVDAVDHVDLENDERTLWELEQEGEGRGKKGEWRSRVVWP